MTSPGPTIRRKSSAGTRTIASYTALSLRRGHNAPAVRSSVCFPSPNCGERYSSASSEPSLDAASAFCGNARSAGARLSSAPPRIPWRPCPLLEPYRLHHPGRRSRPNPWPARSYPVSAVRQVHLFIGLHQIAGVEQTPAPIPSPPRAPSAGRADRGRCAGPRWHRSRPAASFPCAPLTAVSGDSKESVSGTRRFKSPRERSGRVPVRRYSRPGQRLGAAGIESVANQRQDRPGPSVATEPSLRPGTQRTFVHVELLLRRCQPTGRRRSK